MPGVGLPRLSPAGVLRSLGTGQRGGIHLWFRRRVERLARPLVTFEAPPTVRERLDMRWGDAFVVIGFFPLAVGLVEGGPPSWLAYASVAGTVIAIGGLMVMSRAGTSGDQRRLDKLAAAGQRSGADDKGDSPGRSDSSRGEGGRRQRQTNWFIQVRARRGRQQSEDLHRIAGRSPTLESK